MFPHVDPTTFVGLSGVPLIEQVVEYLKDYMRLPAYLSPLAALLLGAIINISVAYYLHLNLMDSFYAGLLAGFGSSYWHELATPSK